MTIEKLKAEAEIVIDYAMDSISWYLTEYEEEFDLDTIASIFIKTFEKTIKAYVKSLKESGVE